MVTQHQSQSLSRSDILNALHTIKPRQWVLYNCSHPLTQLSLSLHDTDVVQIQARIVAKTGRAMLFQKKKGIRYYYYARGVDPAVKNIIETAAFIAPLPVKESVDV